MASLQSIELWLVALVLTICVVGGFGAFARWCGSSPAVRRDRLDKLRVGMTTAEVVAVIGQPRERRHAANGNCAWVYGSPMKRHALLVEFNPQDRMLSFTHGVPGAIRHRNPFPEE
jgi:outer membrane protein assembly factor BamE (lipoprotein component of BamABCDE complex)